MSENLVIEIPEGRRLCKVNDCPNLAVPRYTECNQCRLKRQGKIGSKFCSGCHKELTTENSIAGKKTCYSCIQRKTKTERCQATNGQGEPCNKNALASFKFCKVHLKVQTKETNDTNSHEHIDNMITNYTDLEETARRLAIVDQNLDQYGITNKYEQQRKRLIKQIQKINSYSPERIQQINKLYEVDEFKPLKPHNFYREQIYNPFETDLDASKLVDELELELEIIPRMVDVTKFKEKEQIRLKNNMWDYFRIYTSCISTLRNPGRHIRGFIREKHSTKYLGIFALGSDVLHLSSLDKVIGWTNEQKITNRKINYLVNIVCCVGLRPICYNLNVGKLIAMSMFSAELQTEHYRRYGHYYACVDTLSIYGKSIQYDRLNCLKFIKDGLTKGTGANIPHAIYLEGMEYLKNIGYDLEKYTRMSSSRIRKLQLLFKELGLEVSMIHNNLHRGIYYGYTSDDSQDFLCGRKYTFSPTMRPFTEIVEQWKSRYARQRINHLIATNRIQTSLQLYQGLTRKEQINLAVKEYRTRLERELGRSNFLHIERIKYRYWYMNSKCVELYHFNKDKYKGLNIGLSPSYLGGLFDGDGSFMIHPLKNGGYQMSISLAQSVINILEILQMNFGGYIYVGRRHPNQRQQYVWRVMGSQCYEILTKLSQGCILKYQQTKICQEFYYLVNQKDEARKRELAYHISIFNSRKAIDQTEQKILDEIEKPYERLNMEYITGLLDAEGCIMLHNNYIRQKISGFRLNIAQTNHPDILEKIKDFLKVGKVTEDHQYWYISGLSQRLIEIVEQMIEISIVKKIQLKALRQYFETYKMSPQMAQKTRTNLAKIIHHEKHDDPDPNTEQIKQNNQVTQFLREKQELYEKYLIYHSKPAPKSINLGQNNANYGHALENEHRKNIAISKMALMDLSDEQKQIIRDYKNQGLTQTRIAEITGLDRNRIRNVLSNKSFEQRFQEKESKRIEKAKLKTQLSNQEILKLRNAQSKLTIDKQVIIGIVKYKFEVKEIKNGYKYYYTAPEVLKIFESVENLTLNKIKNYWRGFSLKSFTPADFENQDIDFDTFMGMATRTRVLKEQVNIKTKLKIKVV